MPRVRPTGLLRRLRAAQTLNSFYAEAFNFQGVLRVL